MGEILEVLKSNWQLSLAGLGAILLLGAVFNINLIIDRQGEESFGFLSLFGDKGYRIILGIVGIGFICFGIISLLY